MKSLKESILASINESQVKDTKEGKDFIKALKRLGCQVDPDESAGVWYIYPKKARDLDGMYAPQTVICVEPDSFSAYLSDGENTFGIDIDDEDQDFISLDEFDKSDNEHLFYTDKNANLIAQILIKNL